MVSRIEDECPAKPPTLRIASHNVGVQHGLGIAAAQFGVNRIVERRIETGVSSQHVHQFFGRDNLLYTGLRLRVGARLESDDHTLIDASTRQGRVWFLGHRTGAASAAPSASNPALHSAEP